MQIREYVSQPNSFARTPSFNVPENYEFSSLLSNPSPSASDILSNLTIDQSFAQPNPPNPSGQTITSPQFSTQGISPNEFRPGSAHSHRSSVSGSDYSFTTTEMDTDEAERMEMDEKPGVWELREPNLDSNYPTPGASTSGPSPPTVPGSITGSTGIDGLEDREAREKRLERKQ